MRHPLVLALLLAICLAPFTQAFAVDVGEPAEDHTTWIPKQLKTLSDDTVPIAQRLAARDALVEHLGPDGPLRNRGADRITVIKFIAPPLEPLLKSKDPVTALNVAIVTAKLQHLYLVERLTENVDHPLAMVRFWIARGLAAAQPSMAAIGGKRFWVDPLAALAKQASVETSGPALAEQFKALNLTDTKVTAEGLRKSLCDSYTAVLKARLARLGARKIDGIGGLAAAVETGKSWARLEPARKPAILTMLGQLLKWTAQLRANEADAMTEPQQSATDEVVRAAADGLGDLTGDEGRAFAVTVGRNVDEGALLDAQLLINDFVGGEGMTAFTLKKHGVSDPAPELPKAPE